MASDVARFFRVITIFVLLAGVVKTSVVKNLMKNGFVNPVSEPCYGMFFVMNTHFLLYI